MVTPHIETLCTTLAHVLGARKLSLCTAESCTGGLIAASCTQLSGSSAWFERGFVTYSNAAKHELLGVPSALIEAHGAVSEEVAKAMALGALAHSNAALSVAVTGVAGPTGGTAAKPVGTVWLAWAWRDSDQQTSSQQSSKQQTHCETLLQQFKGSRSEVRFATTELALTHLTEIAQKAFAPLNT
jgi:nicotinamide-nucleotide amidase